MIISKTPYRISLFGGGTDYHNWFEKNEGEVISTTINKYLYITCRELPKFFDHKHRIVYSIMENVKKTQIITHTVRFLTRDHAKRTSESEILQKHKINNNIIQYNMKRTSDSKIYIKHEISKKGKSFFVQFELKYKSNCKTTDYVF